MTSESVPIYTIGHSTRSFDEFVALLREHRIATVADVRRFPGSRRHPHFTLPEFSRLLAERDLGYAHVAELGGRRRTAPASRNTAWENASFRSYADHMGTDEFRQGVERLLRLPPPVALVCAEAVPWRCHRQLIGDELLRRNLVVVDILAPGSAREHRLTPFAVFREGRVEYPGQLPLDGMN